MNSKGGTELWPWKCCVTLNVPNCETYIFYVRRAVPTGRGGGGRGDGGIIITIPIIITA